MKTFLVGAAALMLSMLPHESRAANVSIVAVVDDTVITTTDVSERRDLIMATAGISLTVENQQKITPRIVQSLVDETLQLQEAKRQSQEVTDEELAKAIDALGTRGDSKEGIRDFVSKRGLSMRSLESQMRAQLAWSKVVQRKLRRNVTIAQDEVLRAQKAAAASPGEQELRIQALELAIADKAAEEKITKLAEDMALDLKAGVDMASIAARYVANPAVKFSQPAWVPEKELPPALQQALRSVKNGEATPPLRAGNSIQLLQVVDRKTAPKVDDSTEYAIKQIAIAVPKKRDKASLAKLSAVAATLRADYGSCMDETIPKVDAATQVTFLRARAGGMTPQQRAIVAHLEVGDVSEPLLGPDAIRLVVMCEKIEPSSGNLPDAEAIRQQLFAEKIELEAQKHLRNLRRDAYIDVKGTKE